MVLSLIAAAFAAPDDIEEIIVYGDNFARWDETRWFVQSELWIPLGVHFASDQNRAFDSNIFQIRAVIFCEKDARLSKKRWEVTCKIEDIALLATTIRNWKRERDRAMVEEVLAEIDAKLTGKVVQLQVDENGGVTNFDLEGIETSNERERQNQETLRQVITRTMAGFHLRIPDHAQRSGQWVEYNSELMDMPSLTSSRGSTTMVHQVSPYKGNQIVQTVGEGIVSANLPNRRTVEEGIAESAISDSGAGVTRASIGNAGGGAPSTGPQEISTVNDRVGAELAVEMTYKLGASGVAVFRKDDGIMTERVWTVEGTATASSAMGVDTGPFRNAGRIRILGQDEPVDVGPTGQVAWPGREMEGLPKWVPLETLPAGGGG